ncbi:MAG TPA: O-antigen ligase family protein [Thermoanaerobaculia bacterium]|nr:O-antigen ligase family protein [Thermoanaerobaculia bacterium]
MAKKRRRQESIAPPARAGIGAVVAAAVLSAVLAGTALVVDTEAGAAFDAPKRLIALVGTALAAAAALAFFRRGDGPAARPWIAGPASRRMALGLAAAALLLAFLAALASPRRALSLDAMRALALYALLLPLGASRAIEKGKAWLTGTFLAVTAVNAVVSILESRGLFHPFPLETFGDRQETGAYAGNVGYLAITLAFGAVLALGILLTSRRAGVRLAAGGALGLFALTLLVNRNLTALTSTLAGAGVLLVVLYGRRAALPIAAAVLAAVIGVVGYAPLRDRAGEAVNAVRHGNWDALVSFRGGAWAAALEMVRERPLAGFGPGTFAAEYVPHRLAAEIRLRRQFVAPLLTSSYAESHCDYLQVFSDAGVPAGLAVLGAVGCLLAAAGTAALRRKTPETVILLAVLAAGATAALTWFPLQRPVTAVPILLVAGRAWRVSASDASRDTEDAP